MRIIIQMKNAQLINKAFVLDNSGMIYRKKNCRRHNSSSITHQAQYQVGRDNCYIIKA